MLCAAAPLVGAGVRNRIGAARVAAVGIKALLPGFMVNALNDLLRFSEDAANSRDRLACDARYQQCSAEFNEETRGERHTLGGGFRGVGLMPWVVAVLGIGLVSMRGWGGYLAPPDSAVLIFLMIFPTLYRSGDYALELGIGQDLLLFSGILGILFAMFVLPVIGTVVKVLLGAVWAPAHALLFAFKGARFARQTFDYARGGEPSAAQTIAPPS